MAKPKPGTDTPIGPGVLIDDLPIKDKRKVPSTIVQSLEAIRIKLGGDSSYTCDSVQESIDGITNIYDDKMPASNSILSALNKLGEVVEPGGGGNFNVAELTVVNNTSTVRTIYAPFSFENGTTSGSLVMPNMGDAYANVILGEEGCFIKFDTSSMVIEYSGGISRQPSNPNTFRMRDTGTITIVRIEG